jgi:hypothetical protein
LAVAEQARSYQPGRCNIGPAEIAARRRAGHLGMGAALVLATVLLVLDADPAWRLLLFFPIAGAAIGYLQAAFRFCAGFGLRGVFNFGSDVGRTTNVTDAADRAVDRRRSLALVAAAVAISLIVALAALVAL